MDIVAAGYDRVADEYAALEQQEWPRLRRLQALLEPLPDGARVLDVGCGNGVPATAEIARRHRAVGIDVSREQVERAGRNVPAAEIRRCDVLDARFEPGSFDAVVAFYALDHVPRDRHAELFAQFHAWLRPGGRLLFTAETEASDRIGEWLGVPMLFSSHDAETTIGLVCAAGFELVAAERESQREGEREVEYLWVTATA